MLIIENIMLIQGIYFKINKFLGREIIIAKKIYKAIFSDSFTYDILYSRIRINEGRTSLSIYSELVPVN